MDYLDLYSSPDGLAAREGDSWLLTIIYTDGDSEAIDVTGRTITTTLKMPGQLSMSGADAPTQFDVPADERQDTAGRFNVRLPSNHLLKAGLYPYSIALEHGGVRETLLTGRLEVLRALADG